MKTYIIPIVQTITFGAEVEVRAKTKKLAIALALAGKGDLATGDGWDWDRATETTVALGDWQATKALPRGHRLY